MQVNYINDLFGVVLQKKYLLKEGTVNIWKRNNAYENIWAETFMNFSVKYIGTENLSHLEDLSGYDHLLQSICKKTCLASLIKKRIYQRYY